MARFESTRRFSFSKRSETFTAASGPCRSSVVRFLHPSAWESLKKPPASDVAALLLLLLLCCCSSPINSPSLLPSVPSLLSVQKLRRCATRCPTSLLLLLRLGILLGLLLSRRSSLVPKTSLQADFQC